MLWTLIVVILGGGAGSTSGTTSFTVERIETEKACKATGDIFVKRIGESRYVTYHCAKVSM
jgi:hypothetical protein